MKAITTAGKGRLRSLDALRGFLMFWIIGARQVANGLYNLHFPGAAGVTHQLSHSAWNGLTFYDVIFPSFIFVVGVSLVFAVRKRVERGDSRGSIIRHIAWRAGLLFFLGFLYNGGFSEPFEGVRIMGVLQRIALCYFFASLIVLTAGIRVQGVIMAGLLAGYWAVMRFVPTPGFGPGDWSIEGNLASFVDMRLLPGHLYRDTLDPEGILSTIPAIATCLLGAMAGHWMRYRYAGGGEAFDPRKRAGYLALGGAVLIGLGLLASVAFPINKNLWTSSFALVCAGISSLGLAIFYWTMDVKGWTRWAFPFEVIGLNSIAIYLASAFIPFAQITQRLVGGDVSSWLGRWRVLFQGVIQLTIEWLILYWMYRRRIFIRL